MPAVHLKGQSCTGHQDYPPRNNLQGSSNVFVNGIPVHRQGDLWSVHCSGNPKNCHSGALAKGSETVYANSLQLARVGDPVSCGSTAMQGSTTVYCGPDN